MISRRALFALATLLAPAAALPQTVSDSEIRKILADRVDVQKRSVGIVVGIVDAKGRRIIAYGKLAKDDPRPLNGDTVFEIGSMTKVFTSLVMMDMVQRGQIAVTDPISKYLPETVKVPERNGRKITFEDLSTQTSGLPRLPNNLNPKDLNNPYASYTVEAMYRFLSVYELTRDIGSQYEYSNLGVGLLGHVLTLCAGTDYETLVKTRITRPLEMNSTAIALTPDMKTRLAQGHDAGMKPVANWDLPTLAGAGALRSTANDMLTFLSANLGYLKTPLAPAMAAMLKVRKPTGAPDLDIAYAWHIHTRNGEPLVIWHNGGTGGYRTFMGYNPQTGVGVVALSNASPPEGVDDIGRHLLSSTFPLWEPPKKHTEIKLDPKIFDGYTGRYELGPNFILTVSREGSRFYVQATGQGKGEIFAESDREFFARFVDAQFTFTTDAGGRATVLTLHQNGANMPAKRIE